MKKLLFFLYVFCLPGWSQNTIQPKYTYNLPNDWEAWTLAPGGMLLVGHEKGFAAIEAHNNQFVYNYTDLGKIKLNEMDLLDGLPWVVLKNAAFGKMPVYVVLDYFTGKPIFDSQKKDWTAPAGYHYLADEGKFVIWGANKSVSGTCIGIYELGSDKTLALIDLKDKKLTGGGLPTSMVVEGDRFIMTTTKSVTVINLRTNAIEWFTTKLNNSNGTLKYLFDQQNQVVYAYSPYLKAKIYKINAKDGSLMWPKPISLDGAVMRIEILKEGLWVYAEEEKSFEVNLFDPGTAARLWKKPYSDKGGIREFIFQPDGVVFGTSTGEVNTLLHNGTLRLSKNIDTGAPYRVFALNPDGSLFYLSGVKMGVANLQDGSFVKEPAKFRKVEQLITAMDRKNNRFVVSTGNELFFITRDGTSKKVCDIEFKGGENPSKIEFREGGVLLSSNQNALLVDYDGNIKYNVFYKAPGTSVAGKLLAGAVMVAGAAAGAASAAQAGMMQGATPFYVEDEEASAGRTAKAYSGVAGNAAAIMTQRFNATTATKNSLYIQTSLDEGVGLVKLNKDTGKPEGQIITKDKKPEYLVDEDFGIFYFLKSPKAVLGYDLR
ncbi:MAG: hypothetical protein KatS3mg032_1657 [Cyclobacteriaceae bacterium]|nr:MAG: hypothetical protein KatS3mg032_1657 [Cyclobacteriaceae bacterium]